MNSQANDIIPVRVVYGNPRGRSARSEGSNVERIDSVITLVVCEGRRNWYNRDNGVRRSWEDSCVGFWGCVTGGGSRGSVCWICWKSIEDGCSGRGAEGGKEMFSGIAGEGNVRVGT